MSRAPLFGLCARILSVILLLAGPLGVQHTGGDDFACSPGGGTERRADAVGGDKTLNAEHCVVCHWMRSLRSQFAAALYVHPVLVAAAPAHLPQALAQCAPALERAPARAPPASL